MEFTAGWLWSSTLAMNKFCVFGVFSGLYASSEMLVEHPAGYPVYLPLIGKTE
jgi:hypothetical protein